jgi:hypothetical protein
MTHVKPARTPMDEHKPLMIDNDLHTEAETSRTPLADTAPTFGPFTGPPSSASSGTSLELSTSGSSSEVTETPLLSNLDRRRLRRRRRDSPINVRILHQVQRESNPLGHQSLSEGHQPIVPRVRVHRSLPGLPERSLDPQAPQADRLSNLNGSSLYRQSRRHRNN